MFDIRYSLFDIHYSKRYRHDFYITTYILSLHRFFREPFFISPRYLLNPKNIFKPMRKLTSGLVMLCFCLCFTSCLKDIKDIDSIEVIDDWQPEFALPLVNTTISIQDVVDNFETGGYLDVDGDNFMKLVYQGHIYSITGEEMVAIPDFTIPMVIPEMSIPYGDLNMPIEIDYFTAKKGKIDFSFESTHAEDLDVMIEVKNLSKNGVTLKIETEATNAGSSPILVSGTEDLTDYVMQFVTGQIDVKYVATNANGDQKTLDNFVLEFSEFEYNYVQGYFDQYMFDLPKDEIVIDLFENSTAGNIYVEDPKINLTITNSFGVPIQITADDLSATTADGSTMAITSPLDNGFNFNYPTPMEAGQSKTSMININNTTSNIVDLIANSPKEIQFELSAMTNPMADPSIRGFVKDDSRFDIDVEVEIPMHLSASNFKIENTSEFDASVFDEVEAAEFKLFVENGLPVEAGVQVHFKDDAGVVLATLFDTTTDLIIAAPVDADGKVTNFSTGEQTVMLDADKIAEIKDATQITIEGTASTTDNGNTAVKFYTDYGMSFKLGAKAKMSN